MEVGHWRAYVAAATLEMLTIKSDDDFTVGARKLESIIKERKPIVGPKLPESLSTCWLRSFKVWVFELIWLTVRLTLSMLSLQVVRSKTVAPVTREEKYLNRANGERRWHEH